MSNPERRSAADYVEVGVELLALAQRGTPEYLATVVTPQSLILGSAQPQDDAVTDLPVVRRGTGGGAVLCDDGVLLVDLAVPAGHPLAPDDVTDAYRPLSGVLADALAMVGVPTVAVTVEEARGMAVERKAAARRACWAGLSPYELLLPDGAKLVGLAQRRRRGAVLHQVAIHVTSPPLRVADHLADGEAVRPWLAATAMLNDVPSATVTSVDELWGALRPALAALVSA